MRVIDRKTLVKSLQDNGFVYKRSKGSHDIYIDSKGMLASVPIHCRPELATMIAKQCKIKDLIHGDNR